jgi:hypothetical protein
MYSASAADYSGDDSHDDGDEPTLEIFSADEGHHGGARHCLATEADVGAAPLQQVLHQAAACCTGMVHRLA